MVVLYLLEIEITGGFAMTIVPIDLHRLEAVGAHEAEIGAGIDTMGEGEVDQDRHADTGVRLRSATLTTTCRCHSELHIKYLISRSW
jgi:hypothetical protein